MKTKVVYIMGTGRSGSTAVGAALGNISSVFYAGEIFSWPIFKGKAQTTAPEVRRFWERVLKQVPQAESYFALDFHMRIEHHSALLRPWRSMDQSLSDRYDTCNADLFSCIRAESGAEHVVDSSHYVLRALRLRSNRRLDLRVIYLVRDPREVINALQKPVQRASPMPPLVANLYCLTVWLLSVVAFRRFDPSRRIKIRYEDFVSDPMGVIDRITSCFGMQNDIENMNELSTGMVFQGNRLRESSRISITPQESLNHLPIIWRILSNIIQFPVLLMNGYLRRGTRSTGPT